MGTKEKKNLQLVKVYARQRPFSKQEIELKKPNIVYGTTSNEVFLKSGSIEKKYSFDQVFCPNASQAEVYKEVVFPLINFVLSGYTCTVFAYGQTGTGKTHTMIGDNVALNIDIVNDPSVGMVPRAAVHLFSELTKCNLEHTVIVSFVEIYNEEIRDLLISGGPPLRIYDDPDSKGSTYIKGLTEVTVSDTNELNRMLSIGLAERQTAATNLNRYSSRSHTIFTIVVKTREYTINGEEIIKTGKLHLIDLAGSENIGRSGATEMRAREAGTINKSLLTLGKVIKSLAQKSQHIPYRESKLTRILQDSLGGKSKTCMIATFSPCVDAFDETISTLEYAQVARTVANCPTVNINKNHTDVLHSLQEVIAKLRQELNAAREGEGFYINNESYEKLTHELKAKYERTLHLRKQVAKLEDELALEQQRYDELNKAFLKSKGNVENVTKELENEALKLEDNQYFIRYMKGRIVELNTVANTLLSVCESSTKCEDIYHKKYDYQCNSTLSNANVGRHLSSVSGDCLKQIQNTLDNFVKNQEVHLTEAKQRVHCISDQQNSTVRHLNHISTELQSTSNHNVSFDKLLNNETYNTKNISTWFTSTFNDNNNLQLSRVQELAASVEFLEDFIETESDKLETHAKQCSISVDTNFEEYEKFSTYSDAQLHSLLESLETQYSQVDKQLSRVAKTQQLHELCVEELLAKNEETEAELDLIQQTNVKIDGLLESLRKNANKPVQSWQESLQDVNKTLESLKEWPTYIQSTIDTVEETKKTSLIEIDSHMDKTLKYQAGFVEALESSIKCYSGDLEQSVQNWIGIVDRLKGDLHKITVESCAQIDNAVENISTNQSSYCSDVKQFTQKYVDILENLGKDLDFNVHAGDTPVKVEHDYPKVIDNDVPHDQLRRGCRKMNLQDSPQL